MSPAAGWRLFALLALRAGTWRRWASWWTPAWTWHASTSATATTRAMPPPCSACGGPFLPDAGSTWLWCLTLKWVGGRATRGWNDKSTVGKRSWDGGILRGLSRKKTHVVRVGTVLRIVLVLFVGKGVCRGTSEGEIPRVADNGRSKVLNSSARKGEGRDGWDSTVFFYFSYTDLVYFMGKGPSLPVWLSWLQLAHDTHSPYTF